MNRRDFLKSLSAAAAVIGLPFPDIDVPQFVHTGIEPLEDTPEPAPHSFIDDIISLEVKPNRGEHWVFGSAVSLFTVRGYDVILKRYVHEDGVRWISTSKYDGVFTFEDIERVKSGDFTGFVETDRYRVMETRQ